MRARAKRRELRIDERLHLRILGVLVRANRQELEVVRDDAAVRADCDVEPPQAQAHRTRLHHDDLALEDRLFGALVRMAGEDDVELRDLAGDRARYGDARVGDGDDQIGALADARVLHELAEALHARRVEADHFLGRLPQRRRGIGDADKRDAHAVSLDRDLGREEALPGRRVVEVVGRDVAAHRGH